MGDRDFKVGIVLEGRQKFAADVRQAAAEAGRAFGGPGAGPGGGPGGNGPGGGGGGIGGLLSQGASAVLSGPGSYFHRRQIFEAFGINGVGAAVGARGLGSLVGAGGAVSAPIAAALAAVAAIGGAVTAVYKIAGAMRELQRNSEKAGISVTEYQRLAYSARSTGTDPGELLGSAKRIAELQLKAAAGDAEAQGLFARAGVGYGGRASDILSQLSGGLRSGSVSRYAAAGLAGENALPALQEGIDKAANSFDQLGLALSPEEISKLADARRELTQAFTQFSAQIIRDVIPALSGLAGFAGRNAGALGASLLNAIPGGAAYRALFATLGSGKTSATPKADAEAAKLQAEQDAEAQRQRDVAAYKIDTENNLAEEKQREKALSLRQRAALFQGELTRAQTLYGNTLPGGDTLAIEQARRQVIEARGSLQGLVGQSDQGPRLDAGALAKIGIYRGVNGSDLQTIPREQLQTLKTIADTVKKAPQATAEAIGRVI
jgi:hypothetical protein